MARLLNDDGTPDQFVTPDDIRGLAPREALAFVREAYEEAGWKVDLLDTESDGSMHLVLANPMNRLAYESRLVA